MDMQNLAVAFYYGVFIGGLLMFLMLNKSKR